MLLPLRQSYEGMALGAYWAELLEHFSQEELADEALYQLAKAGFLGLAVHASALMGRVLEIRLVSQQGLRPDFVFCCRCGEPFGKAAIHAFSAAEGGFLCGTCARGARNAARVSPAVPGLWQGLENLALDKLGRVKVADKQLGELESILHQWLLHHTDRPIKSWRLTHE